MCQIYYGSLIPLPNLRAPLRRECKLAVTSRPKLSEFWEILTLFRSGLVAKIRYLDGLSACNGLRTPYAQPIETDRHNGASARAFSYF